MPFTWLAHKTSIEKALQYVEARAEDYMISTRQTAFVFLTGKTLPADLSGMERAVVDALGHGPCSLQELGERVGAGHWTMVPVRRLENEYVVASAGLTPTDIFHVTGEMSLWGREPSERLLAVFSRASGMRKDEFIDRFRSLVTEAIILEIIARGLGISAPVHRLLREPGASELLERMLSGGNADMKLTMKLETPLVGLGAPAGLFLETVASALGTDLVIPEHADVANAVGAVTSSVHVEKRGSIVPDSRGTFLLEGVEGDLRFGSFDEAETYLRVYLDREVKALAEAAGTMNRDVVMEVGDRVGTTADGAEVFLGRALVASVTGEPAIAEGAAVRRATNAARG